MTMHSSERVRIALDISMDPDPGVQHDLADIFGIVLFDVAKEYGVDLTRSNCIIVTRPGGDTRKIPITEAGGA